MSSSSTSASSTTSSSTSDANSTSIAIPSASQGATANANASGTVTATATSSSHSSSASSRADVILYSYWRSSASYRVRLALSLKCIPYSLEYINLLKGEQKSDSYISLNPMKAIPLLIHNGHRIPQSMAILEYLEEVFPKTHPILPKNPISRARARALTLLIVADTHPPLNLRILNELESLTHDPKIRGVWANKWMMESFTQYQNVLNQDNPNGRYSVDDEVSMADLCLIPQLYNGRRFGVDLNLFPRLTAIEAAFKTDFPKEYEAAYPDSQPDADQSLLQKK